MERLKNIKHSLISCVESQMGNLQNINSKELGEAIDMIKDIEEAIYYGTIVEAMEESDKEKDAIRYTYPPVMYDGEDMKYYPMRGARRMYHDWDYYSPSKYDHSYPTEIRDYREGKSPVMRRNYMESKELHESKEKQMKELEEYMNELSKDMTEMIHDATPEEKMMLSQKLNMLAEKIK